MLKTGEIHMELRLNSRVEYVEWLQDTRFDKIRSNKIQYDLQLSLRPENPGSFMDVQHVGCSMASQWIQFQVPAHHIGDSLTW